jgi:hypothetical protein
MMQSGGGLSGLGARDIAVPPFIPIYLQKFARIVYSKTFIKTSNCQQLDLSDKSWRIWNCALDSYVQTMPLDPQSNSDIYSDA